MTTSLKTAIDSQKTASLATVSETESLTLFLDSQKTVESLKESLAVLDSLVNLRMLGQQPASKPNLATIFKYLFFSGFPK